MKKLLNYCLVFFTLFCSLGLVAQQVSGTVTDVNNESLLGVNILVKGSLNGTVTDIDGKYILSANQGDVLVFSYTGYKTQEIAVGNAPVINVSMEEGEQLSEVVVVAYGTQKKATLTGAVSALQGKELVQSPAVDISNSLAGRLPGLVAVQTSGEPGADGSRITIRGTNTLGNSSPLIVIDGIPDRDGGLGRLSPQDIESISVLKDASAAIYGARAANGAILITTKRGKSGKPTITYDFNQGWSQPTRVPEMSNASEYANIMNELPIYRTIPVNEWGAASQAITSTGRYESPTPGISSLNANFSPETIRKHEDGSDPWGFPDTDWFGDVFKTWSPQQRHNLTMSGGSDKFNYFSSLGYVDQDAYYKNSATRFQQYSFRTNIDAQVTEHVSANLGIVARREDRNYPTESAGGIFRMLMRGRPTEPAVWPNGLPGPDIENGQNPFVITTNATGYTDSPRDFTQINGGIVITNPWVSGLKLNLSGAVDRSSESSKIWQTPWMLYSWDRTSFEADGVTPRLDGAVRSNFKQAQLTQTNNTVLNTNLSAILSYDTKIGDHHTLSTMAGVTQEKFTGSNFLAFRRNYISAAIDQLFAGSATQQNTGGSAYERARLGYYGRVNYNYKEKYLAEFIWRYDGSYIFPANSRFGFFPGLSLGWNVTSEDWFNVPSLDRLKLRASYGQMGNDQVFFNNQLQEYAFLATYGFGQYPIDGIVEATLRETVLANPNFTWERANNLNFGVDGTIGGNLDFTLEYFFNKRDQILIQKTGSTPASSGISSLLPPVNAGQVNNSGFEFSFLYNQGKSDFRWSAGINGGYARNKVIFLDEIPGAPEYQFQEGKPINAFLVYESDGVFRDQAAIEAEQLDYSAVTGRLIPGDMRFKDQNNDGKIDADDQVRLNKNTTPTFNFGATFNLQYKNFDMAVLFQGATGAAIRVQTESGDIGNFLKYSFDNRWSIANPSSEHPRLASRGDTYFTGGPYGNNTYYLFNKDYVRLKNLEVGYTLRNNVLDKAGIGNIRIYLNGLNLLTIDQHGLFDPETESQSGVFYPQARVINTGVSVTF